MSDADKKALLYRYLAIDHSSENATAIDENPAEELGAQWVAMFGNKLNNNADSDR